MSTIGDARQLYSDYRELLMKKGWAETSGWPYEHGYFANGVRVPDMRKIMFWEQSSALVEGERIWANYRNAGGLAGPCLAQGPREALAADVGELDLRAVSRRRHRPLAPRRRDRARTVRAGHGGRSETRPRE